MSELWTVLADLNRPATSAADAGAARAGAGHAAPFRPFDLVRSMRRRTARGRHVLASGRRGRRRLVPPPPGSDRPERPDLEGTNGSDPCS